MKSGALANHRKEEYRKMASANDMQAAEKTYASFINLLKYTVPPIAILALLIIVVISS